MNYRRLGHTGLKVSELSLGSWITYGGSVSEEAAVPIVRRAFELGINLFDTADVYVKGEAERVLGKALRYLPREQVVVATKVMGRVWDGPLGAGLSRKHILDAVHASLRRLGVDYVDLYQAHAPDPDTPLEETLGVFEDLVRQGKVRYLGLSNFETPLARRALQIQQRQGWDTFVSSQPRYNLLDREVEKDHLAFCARNGLSLLVYSPLAQGLLTDKYAGGAVPEGSRATSSFKHFMEKVMVPENLGAASRFAAWVRRHTAFTPAQVALAWILRRREVGSVILGASRLEQLEENVKALEVKLEPAQWREVEAAAAAVPARRRTAAVPPPKTATRPRSRTGAARGGRKPAARR